MVGGTVAVELPWLASEMDVRLCYAFLNAVKKVHRAARIMEENERGAKLADCDAQEQWGQRRNNMRAILDKGETVVVTGVTRSASPFGSSKNLGGELYITVGADKTWACKVTFCISLSGDRSRASSPDTKGFVRLAKCRARSLA